MSTMSIPEADLATTFFVEFGPLGDEQLALVDLHMLRAVGTSVRSNTDGVVIEFWLPEGEELAAVYDDIRGWAIGNAIPIRGMIAA